jgi:seryl-tRNA synthetase
VANRNDDEKFRERLAHRGEEAIGDVADALLDNPLFNQAVQAATGARDRAVAARSSAMGAAGVASARDVDRLERRLRALADRLEELEDAIDHLGEELSTAREGGRRNSKPKLYP